MHHGWSKELIKIHTRPPKAKNISSTFIQPEEENIQIILAYAGNQKRPKRYLLRSTPPLQPLGMDHGLRWNPAQQSLDALPPTKPKLQVCVEVTRGAHLPSFIRLESGSKAAASSVDIEKYSLDSIDHDGLESIRPGNSVVDGCVDRALVDPRCEEPRQLVAPIRRCLPHMMLPVRGKGPEDIEKAAPISQNSPSMGRVEARFSSRISRLGPIVPCGIFGGWSDYFRYTVGGP
ncbi:hypothetical protein Nepgr_033751 [Nepenthes gracilis]|uniref:Uncharacterized protein n=1 Tax=Nepenthes gracilis TaxID=150966 RepID=A0AAD3TN08_NEPGR|nr:hypothetical protein Nepgr_033751 [Nepenthes gracilis]